MGLSALSSSRALAEGAAQVGADQNLQATQDRTIGNNTLRLGRLGVDVLAVSEDVTWTGSGNIQVWAPSADPDSDPPTATLSSGNSFDTTEVGAHFIEVVA